MGARNREASGLRSLIWLGLFTLAAFALLGSLGFWQLQRLAWKQDIIGRISARIHAQAVPLAAPSQWAQLAAQDFEYTRIVTSGRFEHKWETLIFRPAGGAAKQPGYEVLTPLRVTGTDAHVLVNRGYIPEALKDPAKRSAGQIAGDVTFTGLLRSPEPRGFFTPADNPAGNIWYSRDPQAVTRHFGIPNAAPFSIDADGAENPGGWPKGAATIVNIRNDHLVYALTWFGLAATLLIIFAIFAWRRLRAQFAPSD